MKKILFLCTGNSCRSQMAHGIADKLYSENYHFYSAGIEAHGVNPFAIETLSEADIDIRHYESQKLNEFKNVKFDLVVAVCRHAIENSPLFHSETKIIHHQFDDPPQLAALEKTDKEKLVHFKRVRDDIYQWISHSLIGHIEK